MRGYLRRGVPQPMRSNMWARSVMNGENSIIIYKLCDHHCFMDVVLLLNNIIFFHISIHFVALYTLMLAK